MKERPKTLPSSTTTIPTGFGKLYVTISELDGRPFEVFCVIGKSGGDVNAMAEVVGRLVSLALRNDIPINEVVKQLVEISGVEHINWEGEMIKSIPDAVGKLLRKNYLTKGE